MEADGTGIRQVTRGPITETDNYDACYLPDGRIIFASAAVMTGVPCVGGKTPVSNLYLMDADPASARRAVIDYGQAIRDLATTNVFPGDLLLKNFGVTRHGRVIFYDYDELCLLSECTFRTFPEARYPEDEMAAEPWFHVGRNDIFPEEFERFLGLPTPLRELFVRHHGDLFSVKLWHEMQQRHLAEEIPDFFPYPPRRRLSERGYVT